VTDIILTTMIVTYMIALFWIIIWGTGRKPK
jgi:hypothetical protein